MDLTRFGVWISGRILDERSGARAAALAEELGFGALWVGGSPRLPTLRPMLAGSERIVIATGIINIWQYEPAELAAEYAQLDSEFPGRVLVGVGIGHPEATSEYQKPLAKTREFLDGIDAAQEPTIPKDRRCVAALGPKMLELSAERSLGTHPYFTPVEHTRFARERLGAGPLIAPELSCVVAESADRARARAFAANYLRMSNYTNNLKRFGFGQSDIEHGGSDRLIDEVVPQGPAGQIAEMAQAHLAAGADHVCVQQVGASELPEREWRELSAALLG
jgi:probable F420-dependent oxidoreductase